MSERPSEQTIVVMALRVEGTPMSVVVAGTERGLCADCAAAIWIAPSTRTMIAQENALVVCEPCALTRIARDDSPELQLPNKDQWREIIAHHRRN